MTMDNDIQPNIDSWYRDLASNQVFQVVALDEEEELIELQHADGDLEELSLDEWSAMDLEVADAPDDWVGPLDGVEVDNMDFSDTRSEGEHRAHTESVESASLQTGDDAWENETLVERQPEDEADESEVIRGTAREARRRNGRDDEA